jgi:hypothetical protein
MTGIWAVCVAIARPYALGIPGRAWHDARVCGTAGLQFRTIAVIPGPSRHERKSTANAVGWQHPPGFKSPILRCDQALCRILGGWETSEMPSGTPTHARRSRPAASPGAEDAVEGTAREAGQPVDLGPDQAGPAAVRTTSSRLPSTAWWSAAHDASISPACRTVSSGMHRTADSASL